MIKDDIEEQAAPVDDKSKAVKDEFLVDSTGKDLPNPTKEEKPDREEEAETVDLSVKKEPSPDRTETVTDKLEEEEEEEEEETKPDKEMEEVKEEIEETKPEEKVKVEETVELKKEEDTDKTEKEEGGEDEVPTSISSTDTKETIPEVKEEVKKEMESVDVKEEVKPEMLVEEIPERPPEMKALAELKAMVRETGEDDDGTDGELSSMPSYDSPAMAFMKKEHFKQLEDTPDVSDADSCTLMKYKGWYSIDISHQWNIMVRPFSSSVYIL